MAEQSAKSHAHNPINTTVLWVLAIAVVALALRHFDGSSRDWALVVAGLGLVQCGWISRAYTVRLQDRIIMLEMKVRAAEVLPAGQDALLAKLTKPQLIALRFASDEELGELLDRAVRENMAPKAIKAAIKNWRPDLHRT